MMRRMRADRDTSVRTLTPQEAKGLYDRGVASEILVASPSGPVE
jgi:hypothetical protein